MAMNAQDGTRHHSASRARLHDEMAKEKGVAATPKREPGAGEKDGAHGPAHPTPSTIPIMDHVQEHGPAHTIHHTFDEAGSKMHHVSSYHGDAKPEQQDHPGAHHSQHKTHAAAHEHMGKAMGLDHEAEERPEAEEDLTPDSEEDQFSGKHAIPGIGQ